MGSVAPTGRWLVAAVLMSAAGSVAGQPETNSTGDLFVTASDCIACHSNLTGPAGEDVSIGYSWRASMMANAARDPYWHAAVRREIIDHPESQAAIEDKCSTCHMPMARFTAAQSGGQGEIFASLSDPAAMDGVSCTVCHQIDSGNFGEHASFDGGFAIAAALPTGERQVFGPHDVAAGHQALMRSAARFVPAQTDHLKASELCATCHTLYTQTLGVNGEVVAELAEQVPYQEWSHSDFRTTQSCQDCHMPELTQPAPITSVLGVPRPGFSQHNFRGANAFVLRMLNRHRNDLGVTALPQELTASAQRAIDFLGSQSASVIIESAAVSQNTLDLRIAVTSLTGHKLPTAYPSRRVWLHVMVQDSRGQILFESGALRPNGSIVGNANDDDGSRFEPHYREINQPDQVQIYEPVLVDTDGRVTTGLLHGARYIKDNRLLPRGFDKATASPDIAVYGDAADDPDFIAANDRIRYRFDVGEAQGDLAISVELIYQTIGFRWAENLKAYDADEPRRFVNYYADAAEFSGIQLANAARSIAR